MAGEAAAISTDDTELLRRQLLDATQADLYTRDPDVQGHLCSAFVVAAARRTSGMAVEAATTTTVSDMVVQKDSPEFTAKKAPVITSYLLAELRADSIEPLDQRLASAREVYFLLARKRARSMKDSVDD